MTHIEIKSKVYSIATTWNELSGKQIICASRILYGEQSYLTAQVELLRILCKISRLEMFLIGPIHLEDQLHVTDFLFETNELTINPVPEYKGYYGPSDELNNMLVAEFIFSELHYAEYKEALLENYKQIDHPELHKMIATLYRPAKRYYNKIKNEDGDIRTSYNDNLTPFYGAHIEDWPLKIKLAIFHWYEGCRQKLIHDNPEVFGGSGGEASQYGLWSVMRNIAGNVHGTIKDVEKMYVKEFLMELNELVIETRKMKTAVPNG